MTDQVYITAKLSRQLDQMARQTSAPAVAARRARQILDCLIRGKAPVPGCTEGSDGPEPAGTGLLRCRRDKRVKNSLKFNLGQGFRLICIKEKKEIYAMFAGDHDSSDAWMDHFTKKRPHRAEVTMKVFSVVPAEEAPAAAWDGRADGDEPEPVQVPQALLRKVFRGLCPEGTDREH